jgi:hypothetical protein
MGPMAKTAWARECIAERFNLFTHLSKAMMLKTDQRMAAVAKPIDEKVKRTIP